MFYFLSHDPELPQGVRDEFNRYGICPDEFQQFGHIPPQASDLLHPTLHRAPTLLYPTHRLATRSSTSARATGWSATSS